MMRPVKDHAQTKLTQQHAMDLGYTKVYSGNGWVYFMLVSYVNQFPRNGLGVCAFCLADPCDERHQEGTETNIHYYYQNLPTAVTCPVCEGRPT